MKHDKVKPNAITFSIMMSNAKAQGQNQKIIDLFEDMKKEQVLPDVLNQTAGNGPWNESMRSK